MVYMSFPHAVYLVLTELHSYSGHDGTGGGQRLYRQGVCKEVGEGAGAKRAAPSEHGSEDRE